MKAGEIAFGILGGFLLILITLAFAKALGDDIDEGYEDHSVLTCYASDRLVYVGRAKEEAIEISWNGSFVRFVGEDGRLYEILNGSCYSTRLKAAATPEAP